jgi:hypothetical protein
LHKDKKTKGYGSWIKNSKGTGPSDSTSTTTNRSGKDKVTEQKELGTSRDTNKKKEDDRNMARARSRVSHLPIEGLSSYRSNQYQTHI